MPHTTYIRHYIDGEPPTVNQSSVDNRTSTIMVEVRSGNAQLDLVGTPQEFLDFAAQLIAIATKAEHDRAATSEPDFVGSVAS